jgi:hypothetical protein
MQPIITENRDKIVELCRQHHVRRLSVFGSAVRDDFDPERSDVDFLVEFEPSLEVISYAENYFSLIRSLETLVSRRIDLITDKYVKNPYLRRAIEAERINLYAA